MDNGEKRAAEDYGKAERVWRRIDPALDPYPEARTARQDAPAWELTDAVESVLRDRRVYQSCMNSRRCGGWQQLAAEAGESARRLMTLYYLEKGQSYIPAGAVREELAARPALLRQQFYRESRMADRLREAAGKTPEESIRRELNALAEIHSRHAELLLRWLEECLASGDGKC